MVRENGQSPALSADGTVHIVDDDPTVIAALRWLLEAVPFKVQSYQSADGFLSRYADDGGPACLVLDLVMPGTNGLELQQALAERSWGLPVIFMSGNAKIADAVQALQGGA